MVLKTRYPSSSVKAGGITHGSLYIGFGWWGVIKHEVEYSRLEAGIWRGPEG